MNESLKTAFINRWAKYFNDASLPIALFFSHELQEAEPAKKFEGHHCIIADLVRVQRGHSMAFNAENIGCGGGLRYCGFSDGLRPGFEYFLSYGIPGKMEGTSFR